MTTTTSTSDAMYQILRTAFERLYDALIRYGPQSTEAHAIAAEVKSAGVQSGECCGLPKEQYADKIIAVRYLLGQALKWIDESANDGALERAMINNSMVNALTRFRTELLLPHDEPLLWHCLACGRSFTAEHERDAHVRTKHSVRAQRGT